MILTNLNFIPQLSTPSFNLLPGEALNVHQESGQGKLLVVPLVSECEAPQTRPHRSQLHSALCFNMEVSKAINLTGGNIDFKE